MGLKRREESGPLSIQSSLALGFVTPAFRHFVRPSHLLYAVQSNCNKFSIELSTNASYAIVTCLVIVYFAFQSARVLQ
jgi:hypothetical protein